MAKSPTPILPTEPSPAAPVPASPASGITLYRGMAIESMNVEQLRGTVRELLGVVRSIAGAQSERQAARIIEGLRL